MISLIINFIFLINLILILYFVFKDNLSPEQTWAWILVLLFIPVIGIILYVFFGRGLSRRKIYNTEIQKELKNHLAHQENNLLDANFKIPVDIPKVNELAYLMTVSGEGVYTSDNKVELFIDGIDKFDNLMSDIDNAKKYIHLEYFCYESDKIGHAILSHLVSVAKRGVKVKVLVDGWGSLGTKKKFFKPLMDNGGEVSYFMPYLTQANYRNHRKIIVIDGVIGYLGGFNIGDSYLGLNPKMGYWRDNHLKIVGSAVHTLQFRFLMDWNAENRHRETYKDEYFPKIQQPKGHTNMQIISSGPDSKNEQIKLVYLKMINLAEKEILIQTPYYIPDECIHEALKLALLSGIKVTIQIPNKPDHLLVYWATYSYVADLLKYGATIEIYQNGFMHAKTLIVDSKISSVGSANFDIRSLHLNFEINSVIYDEEFTTHLRKTFMETSTQCEQLTIEKYKKRSIIIHIKEALAKLVAALL